MNSTPSTTRQHADPEPLSKDDAFHLLQNRRRRAVLRYLFDAGPGSEHSRRDVVEAVAAWENDTTIRQLDSDDRQRVNIALYQSHLPPLAEHDIIDYEPDRGIISLHPRAQLLEPYLADSLRDSNADELGTHHDSSKSTPLSTLSAD